MPGLYLRLLSEVSYSDEGANVGAEWLILEDDGTVRAEGVADKRGLGELIDPSVPWLSDPDNVTLFLPTRMGLSIACEVPGRSAAQVRRALPYVVEEFLAGDVDDMFIAHGPVRRGEPTQCRVLERQSLDDCLAVLADLGIHPGRAFFDAELLHAQRDGVTLLFEDDGVLINDGRKLAAVDADMAVLAINSLIAEWPEGRGFTLEELGGHLDEMDRAQLDREPDARQSHDLVSTLRFLAERARSATHGAEVINLLQGELTPRAKINPSAQRWRSVVVLAGIAVALAFVSMIVEGLWSSYRADVVRAETEALYRDIFGGSGDVGDVRRRVRAQLGERVEGDAQFLVMLTHVADALAGARVRSLNFQEARNEMSADVLLASFDALERVKVKLASSGVEADITTAEDTDDGVRARIRVRGAS